MLKVHKPCYFTGVEGTAKTVTIRNTLENLPKELGEFEFLNIYFSSKTTSWDLQQTIEQTIIKRTGSTYGPTLGTKLVLFIDDMHMPFVDTYGT